jgi:hypothetical protein
MKTKTTKLLLTLACIVFINNVKGQVFQLTWGLTNFGSTTNAMRGIGIGTWPNLTQTNARLHVSNFYCNQPNGALSGFLFRTDGRTNTLNQWQMFTGNNVNNLTENGKIFNYGNNPVVDDQTNFSIQATAKDMTFFTLPITSNTVGTERMRIVGKTGFVGIGTPTPKAKLEVANGDIAVTAIGTGIILKATNGENFYRVTVDNTGKLTTELVANL